MLGKGKIYLTKRDLGKMLKLKNVEDLVVTDISKSLNDERIQITVATDMSNTTNSRIKFNDDDRYVETNNVNNLNDYGYHVILDDEYGSKKGENLLNKKIKIVNDEGEPVAIAKIINYMNLY